MAEVVTKFMYEKSIITSIFSYFGRKPGNEYIVALEDALVASKRDSDGRWSLETQDLGEMPIEMDEGVGQPSR